MIYEAIKNQARVSGGKVAIICRDKTYTYTELVDSVDELTAVLSTALLPGESILFASDKEYHYIRMLLACDVLGITFIPTLTNLPEELLTEIVSATTPDHIILSKDNANFLRPHNKALIYAKDVKDVYTILFNPEQKAVPHTFEGCFFACLNSIAVHSIQPDDVVLSNMPMNTIEGLYLYSLPGLIAGCTVVVEEFDSEKYVEVCEKHKPTIGMITPTMIASMKEMPSDMSHWRELGIKSTKVIPEADIDLLFEKGVPAVRHLYGFTETHVPALTFLILPDTKHKLQLKVTSHYEHKLDRHGILWLAGLSVTKGDKATDKNGYWCTEEVFERRHNLFFYTPVKT